MAEGKLQEFILGVPLTTTRLSIKDRKRGGGGQTSSQNKDLVDKALNWISFFLIIVASSNSLISW